MLSHEETKELMILSKRIQIEVVKMISNLGVGHVGGSLSIADLLAVLYGKKLRCNPKNPRWEGRDWLVVSKGHSGPAVYAALALKGFMPMSELNTLNSPRTKLPSHCDRNLTPGIDMTTGSLGQGSSTAAGVALGFMMDQKKNYVYLVLGDGEINEGQVWEMALFAGHKKLHNLIAFVDYNKLQIDGYTDDVLNLGDIASKFIEFGWYAQTIDGHNVNAINDAIDNAKAQSERPSMIVLNTIKGNGWSATANKVDSHSRVITPEQLENALYEMQTVLNGYMEEE